MILIVLQNEEQFCSKGFTMTYNSDTKHGRVKTDVGFTYGGYSGTTTLHRRFVVKVHMKSENIKGTVSRE
jgi:hypothetical protein